MAVLYADDLLLLHAIKSQEDFYLLQKDVIGYTQNYLTL